MLIWGPFWVSVWGPLSILPFLRVLLGAWGADLGSLLGVSLESLGGRLLAAAKRHKHRTSLERQARFAQKVSPVCVRRPS